LFRSVNKNKTENISLH